VCDLLNIYLAAIACGLAQGATEAAIKYAKERVQFGQPIITFGMVREKIADMSTQIEAGRLLAYNAAVTRDAGKNVSRAASVAKYYMGRAAIDVANAAIQIFGGYGYMKDYPVERYFRDAQVINVLCNTPADEKERIAKEAIG
jgi:alkylation response protein AidB-like acyl-CoA dehydrogenase